MFKVEKANIVQYLYIVEKSTLKARSVTTLPVSLKRALQKGVDGYIMDCHRSGQLLLIPRLIYLEDRGRGVQECFINIINLTNTEVILKKRSKYIYVIEEDARSTMVFDLDQKSMEDIVRKGNPMAIWNGTIEDKENDDDRPDCKCYLAHMESRKIGKKVGGPIPCSLCEVVNMLSAIEAKRDAVETDKTE